MFFQWRAQQGLSVGWDGRTRRRSSMINDAARIAPNEKRLPVSAGSRPSDVGSERLEPGAPSPCDSGDLRVPATRGAAESDAVGARSRSITPGVAAWIESCPLSLTDSIRQQVLSILTRGGQQHHPHEAALTVAAKPADASAEAVPAGLRSYAAQVGAWRKAFIDTITAEDSRRVVRGCRPSCFCRPARGRGRGGSGHWRSRSRCQDRSHQLCRGSSRLVLRPCQHRRHRDDGRHRL